MKSVGCRRMLSSMIRQSDLAAFEVQCGRLMTDFLERVEHRRGRRPTAASSLTSRARSGCRMSPDPQLVEKMRDRAPPS